MQTVYLNGSFLARDEARVPVLDRGFLFGDGVYEVIPVYGGQLFRLEEHLQRLGNSLDAIRVKDPMSPRAWRDMLDELVRVNGGQDQSVYLQVTRGVAARRDHAFPAEASPTVFAMSHVLAGPDPVVAEKGLSAITTEDIRWRNCHIKAITLLPNVLMKQAAIDAGAGEAILLRDGRVTEGSASNVFIVENSHIVTPPKSNLILPGITRDLVIELAELEGLHCQEQEIELARLREADEIWITSSTREILPVVRLDDALVGNGARGTLCAHMQTSYRHYIECLRQGEDPLSAA